MPEANVKQFKKRPARFPAARELQGGTIKGARPKTQLLGEIQGVINASHQHADRIRLRADI